jgi:cytosine/adenosine deaminase-related metal-dependent hydrolase
MNSATLYRARFVLPITASPLEDGAVLVESGRIVAVGPWQELVVAYPGVTIIDFGDTVLLPTMVNAHTHLELCLYPKWCAAWQDMSTDNSFVEWIRHLIRIKRSLPKEAYPASVQAGITACLNSGCGAVGDNLSIYSARSAYSNSPILGRLFFEILGHDTAVSQKQLADIEKIISLESLGEMQCGLAPHSPYSLSRNVLTGLLGHGSQHRLPVSMHLAESEEEARFLESAEGPITERLYPYVGWKELIPPAAHQSPVAYLMDTGPLPEKMLLVHGVHVAGNEMASIFRAGATVVLCPRSNARLGVGRAPIENYLEAGVPLALGTDSLASAESLSIWDELAFCQEWFEGAAVPEVWLEMATLGGARALGLEKRIGCLEPDMEASFQVVDVPETAQFDNLCDTLCRDGRKVQVTAHYLAGRNVLPSAGQAPIMSSPTMS